MRFATSRDYETIVKINKELVNTIVDIEVILFKININVTKTNSYGESIVKNYYMGVVVPCLISQNPPTPTSDIMSVDFPQELKFAFLRRELEERNIYPEIGDLVDFNNQIYEINNKNEVQLFAGRPEYRHSIVCDTNIVRKTNVQLEYPIR